MNERLWRDKGLMADATGRHRSRHAPPYVDNSDRSGPGAPIIPLAADRCRGEPGSPGPVYPWPRTLVGRNVHGPGAGRLRAGSGPAAPHPRWPHAWTGPAAGRRLRAHRRTRRFA